jgi:LmbE family N-acetylglucosaminyl deacetylase
MQTLPESSLSTFTWPILILAPHPDDETLGCGGLIAAACAANLPINILVLTDGTASHPASRTHPAPQLKKLREAESVAAAAALGLPATNIAFLGLRDAHAPQAGADADRAARDISDLAQAQGARTILTTWREDPHCDHLAASILGRQAASLCGAFLWEYPVWGWTLPPHSRVLAPAQDGFRLDVSAHLPAKRRAIACHRSQLGQVVLDDPNGFTLEPRFIELFTGKFETFLRVDSAVNRAADGPAEAAQPPAPKSPPA